MIVVVSWLELVATKWSINTWQVASSLAWRLDANGLAHLLGGELVLVSSTSSVPELRAASLGGIVVPGLESFIGFQYSLLETYQFVSCSADISSVVRLVAGNNLVWGDSSSHQEWWGRGGWASGSIWSESLGLSIWAASVLGVAAVVATVVSWSQSSGLTVWAASVASVLTWASLFVLSTSTGLSVWAASELALGAALWASVESGSLGDRLSIRAASVLSELASASFVVRSLGGGLSVWAATEFGGQAVLAASGSVLSKSSSLAVWAATEVAEFTWERGSLASGVVRSEGNSLAILAASVERSSAGRLSTTLEIGSASKSDIVVAASELGLVTSSKSERWASLVSFSGSSSVPVRAASEFSLGAMDGLVGSISLVSEKFSLEKSSDWSNGGALDIGSFSVLVGDTAERFSSILRGISRSLLDRSNVGFKVEW